MHLTTPHTEPRRLGIQNPQSPGRCDWRWGREQLADEYEPRHLPADQLRGRNRALHPNSSQYLRCCGDAARSGRAKALAMLLERQRLPRHASRQK